MGIYPSTCKVCGRPAIFCSVNYSTICSFCYDKRNKMSIHQDRVENFMLKAGHKVRTKPELPTEKELKLHAELILEEALETIEALGYRVQDISRFVPSTLVLKKEYEPNLIEIADGCADLSVVTICTLSICGIHDDQLFEEVDDNNLAKFGPGGHRNEQTGKWVKPADHKPPNIRKVLDGQRS